MKEWNDATESYLFLPPLPLFFILMNLSILFLHLLFPSVSFSLISLFTLYLLTSLALSRVREPQSTIAYSTLMPYYALLSM